MPFASCAAQGAPSAAAAAATAATAGAAAGRERRRAGHDARAEPLELAPRARRRRHRRAPTAAARTAWRRTHACGAHQPLLLALVCAAARAAAPHVRRLGQ